MGHTIIISFASAIIFALQDRLGFINNLPLAGSYLTELFAGIMGIFIGLSYDRINDLKTEEKTSNRVKEGLVNELETNKKTLERLKKGLNPNSFIQLQTTVWDIFKDKLTFDEVDVYFKLGTLYHEFLEFNNNINHCGNVSQAKSRMRDIPETVFQNMIQEIEEIIPHL